ESRPLTRIDVLRCDAGFDLETRHGTLKASARVAFTDAPAPGWSVRTTVETLAGRRLARPVVAKVPHRFARPYQFQGFEAIAEFDLDGIEPWSAEQPQRYRVVAELLDPDRHVVEVHAQLVGFRHVAIDERALKVNGVPIWVFGVNRHDHHPERGKA